MGLQLYDRLGNLKAVFQPGDNDAQDKSIQGDNVLSLGFKLYEFVAVDVNDYVDFMGERYWAIERYVPVEKNRMEWEYNFQLYGIESLVKRFLVLRNTDGEDDAVFSLTARPSEHLRLIVECVNRGMGTTVWKCGVAEGDDNVVMSYEGTYCDEALRELSDKCGTEWWVDGDTLNLSRCERGEPVALGYGHGLTSLERDKADNAKFYTRLYPIGSSRNIDPERYGGSRLHLPGGLHYVDIDDLVRDYGIVHHYEQSAFSGIYPRRVGRVSSVRSAEVRGTDGNSIEIYYFKDEELDFDPNDYEIGGLVKRVSFQEGSELAGLGVDDDHYFEVNFNSETREFELITIWPYDDGRQLPGGALVPKVGDAYILWNLRMPDEYYRLAEAEFRSVVDAYNLKHTQDVSRYKGSTDHVWIEEQGTELQLGQRVRLESAEYFPESGYRLSRITRISRRLNIPSLMDLEVSDALSHGSMDELNDSINDARSYAGSLFGSLRVPDLVRSWETTKPSDSNVLSGKRSMDEFLNKKASDVAHGSHYEFEGGVDVDDELHVGGDTYHTGRTTHSGKTTHNGKTELNGQTTHNALARFNQDAEIPADSTERVMGVIKFMAPLSDGTETTPQERGFINGNGNAQLQTLDVKGRADLEGVAHIHELISEAVTGQAEDFIDGYDGHGLRIWKERDSVTGAWMWHITADYLTIRQQMKVFELLIQKIRSTGGTIVVSNANGKVKSVSKSVDNTWRITFETGCDFAVGDIIRCQSWKNMREQGSHVETSAWTGKVYAVQGTGEDAVVIIPDTAEWFSGSTPKEGDECVQWGSTNEARQNIIYITAAEGDNPAVDMLGEVTGPGTGNLHVRIGKLDGIVTGSDTFVPQGWGLYADNAFLKGKFVLENGGDVHQLFVLQNGRLESTISETRALTTGDSIIANPAFLDGFQPWNYYHVTSQLLSDGEIILSDGEKLLSGVGDATKYVGLVTEGMRTFVRIVDNESTDPDIGIEQDVTFMRQVDGKKTVELSFEYRIHTSGDVLITLDSHKNGIVGSLSTEKTSDLYGLQSALVKDGEWHTARVYGTYVSGNGSIQVCAKGNVDLSAFQLYEAVGVQSLSTSITQTSEQISLQAERITHQGNQIVRMNSSINEQADQITALNQKVTTDEGRINSLEQAGFVTTTQMAGQIAINVNNPKVAAALQAIYPTEEEMNAELAKYVLTEAYNQAVGEINAELANRYTKNETYSKTEIDTATAGMVTKDDMNVMFSGYWDATDPANPVFKAESVLTTYLYTVDSQTGEKVIKGGILLSADMITQVAQNIRLTADKIEFRGYVDANGLKIDTEGNVTTFGVVNNGTLTINASNIGNYCTGFSEGSGGSWIDLGGHHFLDVLRCPPTIIINHSSLQSLWLPVAYLRDADTYTTGQTKFGHDTWQDHTIAEMRSMIGKKLNLYIQDINPQSGVYADLLVEVNRHEVDVVSGFPQQGDTISTAVTKTWMCVPTDTTQGVGIGIGKYLTIECKTGVIDNHECIYWEATHSATSLD